MKDHGEGVGGGVQAWRTGESTQPMPAPPYVQGSVWCWFPAPRGFSPATAVPFSPLLRNQHFQLPIRCSMIEDVPICRCATTEIIIYD